MKFQIVNIEPDGFPYGHFLEYYCRLLCYGLESLGHDCILARNELATDRTNILFGAHLLTQPGELSAITSAGPYIVVQSEIIQPHGINLIGNKQTLEEVYIPLMLEARAVWEGIPRNMAPLRQIGVNALPIQGGYHPNLHEIHAKRNRDIDFTFFGSITPHRKRIVSALKERGHQVFALFDPPRMYRNDILARTKLHLAPHQGDSMHHLAYGRICYLLNNNMLPLVERCSDQGDLEECFPSAPTEDFIEFCEAMLKRHDRDQLREMYCERFRARPITAELERLVEQSFSRAQVA